MRSRRVLRVSLALIAAVGVQVAHGAPTRSVRVLRAVSCCRHACHHDGSASESSRCCGLAQGDVDQAARTPAAATGAAAPAGLASVPLVPLAPVVAPVDRPVPLPHGRAAPLFLATHALLI